MTSLGCYVKKKNLLIRKKFSDGIRLDLEEQSDGDNVSYDNKTTKTAAGEYFAMTFVRVELIPWTSGPQSISDREPLH